MGLKAEVALRNLFRRCVECQPGTPACPACGNNEICSMIQQTCDHCAHNVCISNPNPAPKSSSGPNVGAIAGGVIGGVALVLIVMYLLWRFWIKKIKAQRALYEAQWKDQDYEDDNDTDRVKSGGRFEMRAAADAASMRTRASYASFKSRMSNIIHIAFVPGVTSQRSGHASLLTDVPVPPIPAAYANSPPKSPFSSNGDGFMFGIEDLRNSTYSDTSSRSSRRDTQYTHKSISPSITSEFYHDDVTLNPMPATMGTRGAPRLVSISKSSQSSPTTSTISSNPSRLAIPIAGPSPYSRPNVPRSLSGGSLKYAQAANKKARTPSRQLSDASNTTASTDRHHIPSVSSPLIEMSGDSESEDDEHARARQSLLKDTGSPNSSTAATPIMQPLESPFFDASEMPLSATPPPPLPTTTTAALSSAAAAPLALANGSPLRPNPYAAMSSTVGSSSIATNTSALGGAAPVTIPDFPAPRTRRTSDRPMGGLSAVIEEATRRSSRVQSYDGGAGARFEGDPFSDAHASH